MMPPKPTPAGVTEQDRVFRTWILPPLPGLECWGRPRTRRSRGWLQICRPCRGYKSADAAAAECGAQSPGGAGRTRPALNRSYGIASIPSVSLRESAVIEYRAIRGRRDADVKSLGAISALSNNDPESLQRQIEFFASELDGLDLAQKLLIGAYVGAELIGFCRFVWHPRLDMWWCRGLEVAPQWQRKGVGTSLLVAALRHLAARGAKAVRSDTASGNLASRATHLKAGFRQTADAGEDFDGHWRDNHCYYQWDAK